MVMFDVVEAILFRCRVTDQLRCKSVCKSWYSLISSPCFIKTHVKFVCNKEDDARRVAMITSYEELAGDELIVTECESGGTIYEYRPGEIPPEWEYYDKWRIVGSSNGLVLYSGNELGRRICVTNPVTREFRQLEPAPIINPTEKMRCFGFGYDSSTDDYKVVVPIFEQTGKLLVHILSLKSNTWNICGHFNYRSAGGGVESLGILFNGALHWFWFDFSDRLYKKPLLVSFDLAKEEFREIPQPDDPRYVWNIECSLGIIEGRLCIYPSHTDEPSYPSCGTWVIKNYNVNSPSWELLSKDCEMYDHAIHYILNNDTSQSTMMPTYYCDENIQLSRSTKFISFPVFSQTLVSPYVNDNNNGGPSHPNNNKSTANAESVKEEREIEVIYSTEDLIRIIEVAMGLN